MSRIGKKPIEIPQNVELVVDGSLVKVKGPRGELSFTLSNGVSVGVEDNRVSVSVKSLTKDLKALWGTTRAVLANMLIGVSEGFIKRLEIHGVGYRAQLEGDKLVLKVGFSHLVEIKAPEGIDFSVEKNTIAVSGIDKVLVGETAARIRNVKKPEPYKGKGIRYEGEVVRRKAGKKAVGGAI